MTTPIARGDLGTTMVSTDTIGKFDYTLLAMFEMLRGR